jgi:hypothetical protein
MYFNDFNVNERAEGRILSGIFGFFFKSLSIKFTLLALIEAGGDFFCF